MRRSLALRANPTARQIRVILARVERALAERGVTVHRETPGEVSFRLPPPWRLAPIGWLALLTGGTATVSAWGGGPWRVTYRLRFGALQALTGILTLAIVVLGWSWPRFTLVSTVLTLWVVGYGTLHLIASHQFRRLLRQELADVVERRTRARVEPTAGATAGSQQPE